MLYKKKLRGWGIFLFCAFMVFLRVNSRWQQSRTKYQEESTVSKPLRDSLGDIHTKDE